MKYHHLVPSGLILAVGLLGAGVGAARAQSTYPNPYAINLFAGLTRSPGSANGSPGQFAFPYGVAADTAGNIYVGDTANDTIRKITPAGVVSTLAGQATVAGSANGTGAGATFNAPEGVAVDTAGNVYVADISNTAIRKITPAGVVTTLAGLPGTSGTADGTGSGARFSGPSGVAVDTAGNVYVTDTYSDTIRKVSAAGVVTTFAGLAGSSGSVDAAGSSARFNQPAGVAVDAAGNVYVADTYNDTIRKITPAGSVTTLAGLGGSSGSADGTGTAARFYLPVGIAVDAAGNLYLADTYNDTIRGITPAGIVTTLAGQVGISGAANGSGLGAQFYLPYGVAVDSTGDLYVADTLNITIRKGDSFAVPIIVTQPLGQTVSAGATATLSVVATGAISYQWYLNGAIVTGATGSALPLANVGTGQAGSYTVGVSNGTATVTSIAATVTVNYSARLTNISARATVGTGANILIAGFGVGGTGAKNLLLRGDGPALAAAPFNLSGTLASPQLTLYDSVPAAIVTDIGWGNAFTLGSSAIHVSPSAATAGAMSSAGAFPLASGSADSALLVTAPTGNYTSQISGVANTTGIALTEIYDIDAGTPAARLTNISARVVVGVGGNILIGGFGITGATSETLLIRGVGPGLAAAPFNLSGTLANPSLAVYDSSNKVIASNIGWGNSSALGNSAVPAGVQAVTAAFMATVGAFPLAAGSTDCAMLVTLPPGNYTAEVSGVGSSTGIALIEVYEFP